MLVGMPMASLKHILPTISMFVKNAIETEAVGVTIVRMLSNVLGFLGQICVQQMPHSSEHSFLMRTTYASFLQLFSRIRTNSK